MHLPAVSVVAGLKEVKDVLLHLGISAQLWKAFVVAVGDPGQDLRPLAALPKHVVVHAMGVATYADGAGVAAIQSAQVGLAWRIARFAVYLQNGGVAEDFVDVDPWEETSSSTSTSTSVKTSVKDKVMKMANVLDQCDDSEAVPPDGAEVQKWTQRYVTLMGSYPDEDEEPTDLQLGALNRRVNELGQAPFVDFSVWQPYGRRTQKALKFRAFHPVGDGSYVMRELPGPQNMMQWTTSWRVFRTACLRLDIVSLSALQVYERNMERLVLHWPNVWGLIVQADDKARGERLEKVRRQILADKQKGKSTPDDWTESKPWSACFRMVAQDERYWNEQVVLPATSWLANGGKGAPKAPAETIAMNHLPGGLEAMEVPVDDSFSSSRKRQSNRDKKDARRRRQAEQRDELMKLRKMNGNNNNNVLTGGKGKKGSGKDQSGQEICYSWAKNMGACAGLPPGSACKGKVSRQHKCMLCLSPGHNNDGCTQGK